MPHITLLSDFGLRDASVAIAKGILMQQAPGAVITDISHEVKPFYTAQAAYLLGAAYGSFPQGTVHIALFDLFSDAGPRLVLSQHRGHYFLTPDNGLLPLALGTLPERSWLCMQLLPGQTMSHWLSAAGSTATLLDTQTPEVIGLQEFTLSKLPPKPHTGMAHELEGEVIHIDHYENVVMSITKEQFDEAANGRRFRIFFSQDEEEVEELSSSYNDVREGYKLCRFNSNGYLELCINRGKAASLFGLRIGSRHNGIKITFE